MCGATHWLPQTKHHSSDGISKARLGFFSSCASRNFFLRHLEIFPAPLRDIASATPLQTTLFPIFKSLSDFNKITFMKRIFSKLAPSALALVLALGASSCANDLELSIEDPQTNTTFDANALMAKIYGNLILTGVDGPAGNADLSKYDNEGNTSFYRRIFEANELPTDEVIWTWQNDPGIPEITNISWNSSHTATDQMYYRMMFNITLCNSFLDNTAGTSEASVLVNRAEVRFMRALHYAYFCDLFGKAPFKTTVDEQLPVEKNRKEVYDFVIAELKDITGEGTGNEVLPNAGAAEYGRADKGAAWMLLSRMYLNAQVYTGTADWANAVAYADKVINSGAYALNTTALNGYTAYEQLFMGDNGENANARKEIIFPIRCDGLKTQSYGGSTYLIASTHGNGTPDAGLPASAWTCNRAREAGVLKFFSSLDAVPVGAKTTVKQVQTAAGDDRALFYSGADVDGNNQRTATTEKKTTFTSGLSIVKWTNLHATGSTPSHGTFTDGDIPLFRLAEAYLTRAEANYRKGSNPSTVLADLNLIRSRAHATILTAVDEQTLLDEWSREFYFEGRRRSDLVRFGKFTSSSYVWDWKGGVYTGTGVRSHYNVYPIPYDELTNNVNMKQNPGY